MSVQVNTLKSIVVLLGLLTCLAESVHFCFNKNIEVQGQHSLSTADVPQKQIQVRQQSQLRSYHPHYLTSLSYPYPMTPHIYYGEVIGSVPLFLYADVDKWHPNSIQKLTINGIEFTDASAKYYLLRRQEVFRYMLVIQMQNSFERDINYTMEVHQRKDHFLVICKYEEKVNAFAVFLSINQQLMDLGNPGGININVRNQTGQSARANWKFSRSVRWIGQDRVDGTRTNFRGFVLEIEYEDRSLLEKVKINVREIKYDSSVPLTSFIIKEPGVFDVQHPEKINIQQKFTSCSATAYQKIIDGLSYEYGRLQIKDGAQFISNEPKELLSFCPSGKRFPWGFLWDDGFHCEVAVRKDYKLVLKVIKSWLDTQLDNGWIPREQNRGAQRQDLCNCPRFMPKDIRDGNPPTLILALDYLNKKGLLTKAEFPSQYWLKIKKWYQWFMNTQKDGEAMLFKWHDSLNQEGASFTSGMDDFPRPVVSKGQIDLQTWMYFFTKFLVQTSHIYNQDNDDYIATLQLIKSNFKFFISPDKTYRDISVDSTFSSHFGYPNILPIAFGIPSYKSPQYNATITKVKEELDTGNGLASISKLSSLYLQNKDAYWRGPVWININYLFLRGLKIYYPQQKQLYDKIRGDILRVVCDNWKKSGYFYQNYINGKGSFGYPFNGWTSLVAILQQQNF